MSFSYDATDLSAQLNHLRFLVQDTTDRGHFFEDAEITFAAAQETNIYRAAANLCRSIAARLSKTPSLDDSTLKFEADKRAAIYLKLVEKYDKKADELDESTLNAGSMSLVFPSASSR